MPSRADRIAEILHEHGGRLSVRVVGSALAKEEKTDADLLQKNAAVSAAARIDNKIRLERGQSKRFRVFERGGGGDEEFGYISLVPTAKPRASRKPRQNAGEKSGSGLAKTTSQAEAGIASQVEAANAIVRRELKVYIAKLSWQDFESVFLSQLLNALGFQDVIITPPTNDGGQDATCTYQMGIVSHEAIVSAKHWHGSPVGPGEVQRVRGVASNADIGIIVTSSRFTSGAVAEAEKRHPGHRTVILVDGDLIVETCIKEGLGVQEEELPKLFRFKAPSISDDE